MPHFKEKYGHFCPSGTQIALNASWDVAHPSKTSQRLLQAVSQPESVLHQQAITALSPFCGGAVVQHHPLMLFLHTSFTISKPYSLTLSPAIPSSIESAFGCGEVDFYPLLWVLLPVKLQHHELRDPPEDLGRSAHPEPFLPTIITVTTAEPALKLRSTVRSIKSLRLSVSLQHVLKMFSFTYSNSEVIQS